MGLINLFKTFTKGQENAQDQLNENFAKLEDSVQDTGWQNLQPNEGYSWLEPYPVQYRIKAGVFYMCGVLNGTGGLTTGTIAKLPPELCPKVRTGFSVACWSSVSTERASIYVYDNGNISLIAIPGNKNIWMNEISYPLG